MKKALKKSFVMMIVFILTFANYGFAINAIATESASVFEMSIFKKSNIEFKAYFDGENEKEKLSDVNDEVVINAELNPKVDGILKEGKLKLNLENSEEANFEIVSVTKQEDISKDLEVKDIKQELTENLKSSEENFNNIETQSKSMNSLNDVEKQAESIDSSSVDLKKDTSINIVNSTDKIVDMTADESNTSNMTADNTVADTSSSESSSNSVSNNVSDSTTDFSKEDEVIDEDKVIEETSKEIANEKENVSSNSEVSLTEENDISISNVISNTKFRIVIKYKQGEKIKISDLYKKLNLTLEGTFVNTDLEESQETESETLKLGWTYSKEIEVTSEYNKISPFTVGKTVGTIVQNEISVKREVTEDNYLPVKETNIQIQVPTLNGKYPTEISVNANRLMATRGETFGAVTFTNDNWKYNEKKHTIEIKVENEENGTAVNSYGEDNFVVAYRYEDYIEGENIELDKDVTVKVEEYSGKENKVQEKRIEEKQNKEIDAGELITYTVGTTDEAVSKGKINANYYSETAYETEIKTIVSLNILTSDMLEAIKVRGTKEEYIDKTGESYDASGDVKYKGVNFNYSEIKDILKADGTIDLLDKEGNIIYTLDRYNTKSDESTKIELSEYTDNLQVRINKVKSNGTINIEFVKVIGKSNYKAVEFNDFKSIKSTVETSVKYVKQEGTFTLKTMDVEKEFTESFTSAKLYMNKEYLSTVEVNKNVQLKIELNNNKETSDLYKNPYFEIVFPKYVKAVEIQDINLMDEKGLQIKDFHTVEENGTIKVKVELEGTQTEFVGVNLTNGTNIVINANITVDDYTPKKQDQVKLYYYNEAVTNYVMQTKWSVNKNMPSDIIKVTNGFDLAVFEYQAPTGLVPVNEIKNYDGKANNVKSVKQGTVEKQIEIKQETQISQMKLTALNNTGNDCTDVVLLGRIPFKGNKDVVTGSDLGTTVTTTLKDKITADGSNTAMATIYYSSNPEADKNLSDENNGWTQEITDISEIKSYLIVVDGTLEAGKVLNYSYDFEIPSELPYESAIYGSFGVYYNNNSDVAVVYESSIADKVGLVTEKGPKLEANLSVDIGDGNDVLETRRLTYTVTVSNTGSVDAENVVATVEAPENGTFVVKGDAEYASSMGDYGFMPYLEENVSESGKVQMNLQFATIKAGESKDVTFYIKSNELLNIEEYCQMMGTPSGKDEKGYYYSVVKDDGEDDQKDVINDENKDEYLDEDGLPKKVTKDGKDYFLNKEKNESGEYTLLIYRAEDGSEISFTEGYEIFKKQYHLEEDNPDQSENDEEEYEYEKVYVDKVPDSYIETKAKITCENLATEFETNTIKNKVIKANFELSTNLDYDVALTIGAQNTFEATITNLSDKTLKNVVVYFKTSQYMKHIYSESNMDDTDIVSNDDTGVITYKIGKFDSDDIIKLKAIVEATNIPVADEKFESYFEISAQGVENEVGTKISQEIVKPLITSRLVSVSSNELKENDTLTATIKVKNEGLLPSSGTKLLFDIPEIIQVKKVTYLSGEDTKNLSTGNGNKNVAISLPVINADEELDINIEFYAINSNGTDTTDVKISPIVTVENQDNIKLEDIKFTVLNDKLTQEEEDELKRREQEEADKDRIDKAEQDIIDKTQNNTNKPDNNQNNDNNNNSNDNNQGNNEDKSNNIINNKPNDTNQDSSDTKPLAKYAISGIAWLDENKDGQRDSNEKLLNGIKVSLIDVSTSKVIQNVETDSNGKYVFNSVEVGKYVVAFSYDNTIYELTSYKASGVSDDKNSDVIKSETSKMAVTSQIEVKDRNITNIDIGLISNSIFDLKVSKYLDKAIVTTKKGTTEYDVDNKDIAKVEIKSKEMKNSTVKLEYKIVIENVGNVEGYAKQIVDYLEQGYEFDEKDNSLWYLGNDGLLYTNNLDNVSLAPGEKREFKLVLSKKLDEPKTIIASNKIELTSSFCKANLTEGKDNNTSIQTTFISVATGRTIQYIAFIMFTIIASAVVYLIKIGRLNIKLNTKKFYK